MTFASFRGQQSVGPPGPEFLPKWTEDIEDHGLEGRTLVGPRVVTRSSSWIQSWPASFVQTDRSQTMDCLWTMNSSLTVVDHSSKMMGRNAAIMDGWWTYFTNVWFEQDHLHSSVVSTLREFDMATGSFWFQWALWHTLRRHLYDFHFRSGLTTRKLPWQRRLTCQPAATCAMDGCIGSKSLINYLVSGYLCFFCFCLTMNNISTL